MGNHSLEDFPIILEKIINKKNVNILFGVPKHEAPNTKNMHIITKQGMKIGGDNPNITKIQRKENNYPNPNKKKDILNDATTIFEELTS